MTLFYTAAILCGLLYIHEEIHEGGLGLVIISICTGINIAGLTFSVARSIF